MAAFIEKEPLFIILASIAAGPLIAAAPFPRAVFYMVMIIALAACAAFLIVRDKIPAIICLACLLAFGQAARVGIIENEGYRRPGDLEGTVISAERDSFGRARYVVSAENHRYQVISEAFPVLRPGDEATWSGDWEESEPAYGLSGVYKNAVLREHAEGVNMTSVAYRVRHALSRGITDSLPEPHGSLLSGIVLGTKDGLTPDMREDFRVAGLSHIVVLSGFNLSVAAMAASTFGKTRKGKAYIGIIAVWLFAFIAGAGPSVMRAAIMVTAALYASSRRRFSPAGRSLILAAACMLMIEPRVAFQPSFQLSFLATVGVLGIAPWIHARLARVPDRWGLREITSSSLGAYCAVIPITIGLSDAVQTYSIIANVLVVPLVSWLMYVGILTSIAGFAGGIGIGFGVFAFPLLDWAITVARTIADFPGSEMPVQNPERASLFAAALLICLLVISRTPRRLLYGLSYAEKRDATTSQLTAFK